MTRSVACRFAAVVALLVAVVAVPVTTFAGPDSEPPTPRGKPISFDLKLKWPGAETMPVEPYVTVGPTLTVTEPDSFAALAGSRVDPAVRFGAKVGAGLNWRLGKDTTLFGAYGFTTESPNGLLTDGPRKSGDAGNAGFDLMYGVRFRY